MAMATTAADAPPTTPSPDDVAAAAPQSAASGVAQAPLTEDSSCRQLQNKPMSHRISNASDEEEGNASVGVGSRVISGRVNDEDGVVDMIPSLKHSGPTNHTIRAADDKGVVKFADQGGGVDMADEVPSAASVAVDGAQAPPTTEDPPCRRSAMQNKSMSHRSFFTNALQRSHIAGKRGLLAEINEKEGKSAENGEEDEFVDNLVSTPHLPLDEEMAQPLAANPRRRSRNSRTQNALQRSYVAVKKGMLSKLDEFQLDLDGLDEKEDDAYCNSDSGLVVDSVPPQDKNELAKKWRSRTKRFFTHQEQEEEDDVSQINQQPPPESEVERIVQRLEQRNANREHVPIEVKNRFLRLCNDACRKRCKVMLASMHTNENNTSHAEENEGGIDASHRSQHSIAGEEVTTTSSCILREDVIQIRKAIRREVEGRTRRQRILDGTKQYFGFRCHSKVLLHVLNRAVDLIDESGHAQAKRRRRRSTLLSDATPTTTFNNVTGQVLSSIFESCKNLQSPVDEETENEWFYYKDFAFYSLKIESNYPWMRSAGVFSILMTVAFYIFTPVFWCSILNDPNICPRNEGGNATSAWLSALFFASATMSTVGYGDITVFTGSDDIDTPEPESWRIFIATLFMILSLVVSVVGFQAGLDSSFSPFRRRLDIFGKRLFDILKDANIVKGKDDKHEEITSRMRYSKFSEVAEITLIFLILNLLGVFAIQLSLLSEEELSISWMTSLYWAVQTTTTIGYGDVDTPESIKWFLLLYLAISTYFVGSAFGKLGKLNAKLESMQLLYLWEQQEPSYTMLQDFSGRPERRTNDEGDESLDFEPEIDQFEFTIASLVVMGKITCDDVKPILEKFKRLTGENPSKITPSDVSGPIRKKQITVPEKTKEKEEAANETTPAKSSSNSAIGVGKKIAQAFREEILIGNVSQPKLDEVPEEKDTPIDYSDFRIPKSTHAIAIDDSKIQRKLLAKLFDHAGIPADRCTVVGDGYDEIMGFEDYVVKFIENHDGYVFMIVDENLDVIDSSKQHQTISGSLCVENIRRRLPNELERRLFALIRSANDSTTDIALYESRAHGFLPKRPIKRDKMNETLAPLWLGRFPPSEFESTGTTSTNEKEILPSSGGDIVVTPFEITQKLSHVESLFQNNIHITEAHIIHDQLHELKGDIGCMNLNVSAVIGQINLIHSHAATQAPETLVDRWRALKKSIEDVLESLQKNWRLPPNTFAIAIDDSKIQRKLMGKFFDFLCIPKENCTIVGDGYSEVSGFEDLVVNFMESHRNDYVLMIVDENLDVVDDSSKSVSFSGSLCVDNIRKRLPVELERRMLALVRSANDSTTDIAIYNTRAHGFLPKAPIRREKVNEIIAPIWMRRFPSAEFSDSTGFDTSDTASIATSIASDEIACTSYDIAQKLIDIESLIKKDAHITDIRIIHDQLHELKGDLLTTHLSSNASMIPILGMINLMLLGHNQSPEDIIEKWNSLRERIHAVISSQGSSQGSVGQSSSLGIFGRKRFKQRESPLNNSVTKSSLTSSFAKKDPLSNSLISTCSSKHSEDDDSNNVK